jgi:transposase
MQRIVCGIDVSSDELNACILLADDSAKRPLERSFGNSRRGVRELIVWLKSKQVGQVVMEASGGYERICLRGLRESGIKGYAVNPARIRDFARGLGKIAKTDKIDAQVIARYGQVVELAKLSEPSQVELELKELIKRRQELQDMMVAEKNRLRLSEGEKEKSLKRVIRILEKELERIERKIEELSRTDRGFLHRIEVLRKQKGIGFISAVSMLSCLPELGKVDRKQIGALAGVSPFNRESGKWKGKSFITGGRRLIRKILYMPALVATRFNQRLREFYQRLVNLGKPKKVALIAVMRKLLIISNAMLKNA